MNMAEEEVLDGLIYATAAILKRENRTLEIRIYELKIISDLHTKRSTS